MAALQFDTGLFRVIKTGGIELGQTGIAPLMLDMAFIAGLVFMPAVQATLVAYIFCDVLVTVLAQAGLRRLVEFLVALAAIVFDFCMAIDHFTWQQDISRVCICLRHGANKDAGNRMPLKELGQNTRTIHKSMVTSVSRQIARATCLLRG